jgi:hypothetical protein
MQVLEKKYVIRVHFLSLLFDSIKQIHSAAKMQILLTLNHVLLVFTIVLYTLNSPQISKRHQ